MPEEKRAIGYICPECGKPVYGERTIFALQAAAVGLVCDCGRSELTAEPCGDTSRLTPPCGVCGGEHRAEIPAEKLLRGPGVGLACPENRQMCCYIGDTYRVEESLRRLEKTLQKQKDNGGDTFADDTIMYEVLSELRDIAARGGISCTCGAKSCAMEVHGGAGELICRSCGGRLRLPAVTDEDLDRLCCQYTLTIHGGQ